MSTSTALEKQGRDRIRTLMVGMQDQIAKVLPKHLTPERMMQVIVVEAGRNPKLRECSTQTLAASIMLASELGLEPSGPLGKMYLIPRRNKGRMECTTMLGYKGLAELARRSGEIARLNANVVYQWELDNGSFHASNEPPSITHGWAAIPNDERQDGKIALAYATAEMKDGNRAQVILTKAEIDARRKRSAANSSGPWGTDYAAMARKTALRALLSGGLVPLSAETPLAKALAAEQADNVAAEEPKPADGRARVVDMGSLLDDEPAEAPAEDAEYVENNGWEALQVKVQDRCEGDVDKAAGVLNRAMAASVDSKEIPDVPGPELTAGQVAVVGARAAVELG